MPTRLFLLLPVALLSLSVCGGDSDVSELPEGTPDADALPSDSYVCGVDSEGFLVAEGELTNDTAETRLFIVTVWLAAANGNEHMRLQDREVGPIQPGESASWEIQPGTFTPSEQCWAEQDEGIVVP